MADQSFPDYSQYRGLDYQAARVTYLEMGRRPAPALFDGAFERVVIVPAAPDAAYFVK